MTLWPFYIVVTFTVIPDLNICLMRVLICSINIEKYITVVLHILFYTVNIVKISKVSCYLVLPKYALRIHFRPKGLCWQLIPALEEPWITYTINGLVFFWCENHGEERSGRVVSCQEAQLHMNQEKVRVAGKRDQHVGLNRHEAFFWSLAHPKNDSLYQ